MKYYDRFDASKRWDKILFIPKRELQTSELNEIQSIFDWKLKKLSDIFISDGSVVNGTSLTLPDSYPGAIIISEGYVYMNGKIIFTEEQAVDGLLTGIGMEWIYVSVEENVITEFDEKDLIDPALGHGNYLMSGAHRRILKLKFYNKENKTEDATKFTYLFDGKILFDDPLLAANKALTVITERNYLENGNFLVEGANIILKNNLEETKYDVIIEPYKAYLKGKRFSTKLSQLTTIDKPIQTEEVQDIIAVSRAVDSSDGLQNNVFQLQNNFTKKVDACAYPIRNTLNIIHTIKGGLDELPIKGSIIKVLEISGFIQDEDYEVTVDGISWALEGDEPSSGTLYSVDVVYYYTVTLDEDESYDEDRFIVTYPDESKNNWQEAYITIKDNKYYGEIGDAIINPEYHIYLSRIDAAVIDSDTGMIRVIKGKYHKDNPPGPEIGTNDYPLFKIFPYPGHYYDGNDYETEDFRIFRFTQEQLNKIKNQIDDVKESLANVQIDQDAAATSSIEGLKGGTYTDPLENIDQANMDYSGHIEQFPFPFDSAFDNNALSLSLDPNESEKDLEVESLIGLHSGGMVGYYPFNGNAFDRSGNENHGVINGASLTNDRFGRAQRAYVFNEKNSIQISHSSSLSFTTAITIAVWVKLTDIGTSHRTITHRQVENNRDWWLGFHPNSDSRIHWSNKLSSWALNADIGSSRDKWRFIVATYQNGIGRKLYVDGELVASDNASGSLPNVESTIYIGGGGWSPISGIINNLRFYNKLLSSSEIDELYEEGKSSPAVFLNNKSFVLSYSDELFEEQLVATEIISLAPYALPRVGAKIEVDPVNDIWIDQNVKIIQGGKVVAETNRISSNIDDESMGKAKVKIYDRKAVSIGSSDITTTKGMTDKGSSAKVFSIPTKGRVVTFARQRTIRIKGINWYLPGGMEDYVFKCSVSGVEVSNFDTNIKKKSNFTFSGSLKIPPGIPSGQIPVKVWTVPDYMEATVTYFTKGTVVTTTSTTATTKRTKATQTLQPLRYPTPSRFMLGSGISGSWFRDPIAQSIRPEDDYFLSAVGVFFKSKDDVKIVECKVCEMDNGYPTEDYLAIGQLSPEEVLVSDLGTAETVFKFEHPVFLKKDVEYGLIIKSDSPDYVAWIAKQGGIDIVTGGLVLMQSHEGAFFTSANAATWTAEQEKDLKFKLYKAKFVDRGELVMTTQNINDSWLLLLTEFAEYGLSRCRMYYRIDDGDWEEYELSKKEHLLTSGLTQKCQIKYVLTTEDENMTPVLGKAIGSLYWKYKNYGWYYTNVVDFGEKNEFDSLKIKVTIIPRGIMFKVNLIASSDAQIWHRYNSDDFSPSSKLVDRNVGSYVYEYSFDLSDKFAGFNFARYLMIGLELGEENYSGNDSPRLFDLRVIVYRGMTVVRRFLVKDNFILEDSEQILNTLVLADSNQEYNDEESVIRMNFISESSNLDDTISVSDKLSFIKISPQNSSINVGEMLQFIATGTFVDESEVDLTTKVTWISSNTNIVFINENGLASGSQAGTVTIRGTLGVTMSKYDETSLIVS